MNLTFINQFIIFFLPLSQKRKKGQVRMSEEMLKQTKGFIETKSGKIHYIYYGDKKSPVMVCCNAFLMDMSSWDKLLPHMLTRTDILLWDYPSQGLSDIPEFSSPSVEENAVFLKEIITSLGLEELPLYFLGISSGGFIALEFTKLYPNLVKKLILASTIIKLNFPTLYFVKAQMELLKQNLLGTFFQALYAIVHSNNFLESIDPRLEDLKERFVEKFAHKHMALYHSAAKTLEYAQKIDEKEYKKIAIPILYIYGEEDFLNPIYCKAERESLLPQAKFLSIPGTAHYPIVEKQKDFFILLDKFL